MRREKFPMDATQRRFNNSTGMCYVDNQAFKGCNNCLTSRLSNQANRIEGFSYIYDDTFNVTELHVFLFVDGR